MKPQPVSALAKRLGPTAHLTWAALTSQQHLSPTRNSSLHLSSPVSTSQLAEKTWQSTSQSANSFAMLSAYNYGLSLWVTALDFFFFFFACIATQSPRCWEPWPATYLCPLTWKSTLNCMQRCLFFSPILLFFYAADTWCFRHSGFFFPQPLQPRSFQQNMWMSFRNKYTASVHQMRQSYILPSLPSWDTVCVGLFHVALNVRNSCGSTMEHITRWAARLGGPAN